MKVVRRRWVQRAAKMASYIVLNYLHHEFNFNNSICFVLFFLLSKKEKELSRGILCWFLITENGEGFCYKILFSWHPNLAVPASHWLFLTSSSILSHIPPISRFMTSMNAIAAIAARTFKAAIDSGKWNEIDGKLSQKEMVQREVTELGILRVTKK